MSAEQPQKPHSDEPLFDQSGVYALTYDKSTGKYNLSIDAAKIGLMRDKVKDHGRSLRTPTESSDGA